MIFIKSKVKGNFSLTVHLTEDKDRSTVNICILILCALVALKSRSKLILNGNANVAENSYRIPT